MFSKSLRVFCTLINLAVARPYFRYPTFVTCKAQARKNSKDFKNIASGQERHHKCCLEPLILNYVTPQCVLEVERLLL